MSAGRVDMKIVLLGKEYGGKTSLVERYLHGRFVGDVPYQATIGAAFGAKRVDVGGKTVTLGIWDTAGSERYESMSRIYYRGAKAAIICYDLTDRESFQRTRFWVKELEKNEQGCRIYLCGTKKDLVSGEAKTQRNVDYHMTTDYGDGKGSRSYEIKAEVFETSSKSGENIKELFDKIALDYFNDPANKHTDSSGDENTFQINEPKKKGPCCH